MLNNPLNNNIGAIDGMLVWIHKPTKWDVKEQGFCQMKCYCGHGQIMQAICDSMGQYLDIKKAFPSAFSNYFAFNFSKIKKKLEAGGFLYPGLALFGDNMYTSTSFMMTLFQSVGFSPKDAFHFFHLQLQINFDCAFEVLVHRGYIVEIYWCEHYNQDNVVSSLGIVQVA